MHFCFKVTLRDFSLIHSTRVKMPHTEMSDGRAAAADASALPVAVQQTALNVQARQLKAAFSPMLLGFVLCFMKLVKADFPGIANVQELLLSAFNMCLCAIQDEMFWEMIMQDIVRDFVFSDGVIGDCQLRVDDSRISKVSLKLVVTSLGLAYKMLESGICNAHVFYCFLLGVECDQTLENLSNDFKLYCFLSDANIVIDNDAIEAHYLHPDDGKFYQVPVRSKLPVRHYTIRAASEMNKIWMSQNNALRYTTTALEALKPNDFAKFENSMFPFIFSFHAGVDDNGLEQMWNLFD